MCFSAMSCVHNRQHMMLLRYARYLMFSKTRNNCLQYAKTVHGIGRRITEQYMCQSVTSLRFFTIGNQSVVCEKKDEIIDSSQTGTDFDNELELSDEAKYFKQLLSPNVNDPVIKLLNSAECVQDVFNIVIDNEQSFSELHVSQAVLVLWNLQKKFYEFNALQCDSGKENTEKKTVENYMTEMNNHDDFQRLLRLVELWTPSFSTDAAACVLMYLFKMNVSLQYPIMQKLIEHCQHLFKVEDYAVSVTALSRFVSTVRSNCDLWSIYQIKEVFPLILKALENCNDADHFYRITVCLMISVDFLTNSTLSLYKKHTERLLEANILTADTPYSIVRCAGFFNLPTWSGEHVHMTVKLIHMLRGRVKELHPHHLVNLNRIFLLVMEPADMLSEIQEHATNLLSEETKTDRNMSNFVSHPLKSELLNCVVSFNSPLRRQLFEKLTHEHLQTNMPEKSLNSLFRILRHLKTADIELCNKFWSASLRFINPNLSTEQELKVFQLCYRYMYFNNNLGGTFRHFEFEKCMIQCLWNILKEGNGDVIPSKFARIASFIIGYGNSHIPGNESITKYIMEKMPSIVTQFSTFDCLLVSRGLDLAMELHRPKMILSSQFLSHVVGINTLLNDHALQRLKDDSLPLSEINSVLKSYLSRGGTYDHKLFGHFIERLRNIKDSNLSSQSVRDISGFLLATRCLIPETMDSLTNYVINNREKLLGETAVKVLLNCYVLGYAPSNNKFFDAALSSIMRDKEKMQGLFVLHSAMSLSYFHQLPESLIHFIFAVNFLEQLDNEIAHCYAKNVYPNKVRRLLMKVNRAVCLDYPEVDIPWFHQKFVQDTIALEQRQNCPIYIDVYKTLASVVGGEDLIKCNILSPYGYKIDFQILLNKMRSPVGARHNTDKNVSRVAIVLLRNAYYTVNVPQLTGELQLKWKHLEIMGYRVVGIKESEWNSMYMSEPKAKQQFIEKQLWPDLY